MEVSDLMQQERGFCLFVCLFCFVIGNELWYHVYEAECEVCGGESEVSRQLGTR